MVQEQEESGRRAGPGCMGWMWLPGPRVCGAEEGAGGRDWSPGSGKSARSGGRWCVVLLSEVQQWFSCNIQRPENMEAGFGEEEHRERQ